MDKTFTLNVPICKIDEEQRIVTGIATNEALDSQGDIVDYEASKKAFADWTGNIREMHNPIAIGKGIDVQFNDKTKDVIVSAKISESADGENAWIKVKEKILTGFSIGGRIFEVAKDKTVEGANRITDYALAELSLVDSPANPEAQLIMVKSKNGRLEMTKAGIAVVDGDARDEVGNSVSHVITGGAPVKGGTSVPKKVYGSDGKSTTNKADQGNIKKSVSDALQALSLASQLSWLIMCESDEPDQAQDLIDAFNAIRTFAGKEIAEGDDFDYMSEYAPAVELAQTAINLRKGMNMADKKDIKEIEKSTNVVGGVERDETATVVEDLTPTDSDNVTVTPTVVDDVVVNAEEVTAVDDEAPIIDKAEVVETPIEEPVTEVVEPVTTDAPVDDGKKSDQASDLVKNVQSLLTKLNDNQSQDLSKVSDLVSKLSDKVEKSIATLEDRIATLEKAPVALKTKASYLVEKGDSETISEDVASLVKRQEELMADPSLAKAGEMEAIYNALRRAQITNPLTINVN